MPDRKDAHILPFILYWSDERYRRLREGSPPKLEGIDLEKLMKIAEKNKLSYYISKRALEEGYVSEQIFKDVVKVGDRNFTQQEQTLRFISSTLATEGAEFLIIKSYKSLPYITVDIDIMVRESQFQRVVDALEAQGASQLEGGHRIPLPMFLERRLSRAQGVSLLKEGLLELDFYQDTTWTGWLCLDNEFIWRDAEPVQICGVECAIPNSGADLMLNLAHVIFCHGFINLLDFLYINSLLESGLDLKALFQQAEKYGWGRPLSALVSRISEQYHMLCHSQDIPKSVRFPYLIPFGIILSCYRGVARASKGGLTLSLDNWLNVGLKLASMVVYRD